MVLSEILPNSLKLWWEVICSLDTSSWEDLEFLIIYNWSRIQPFIIFIIYRVQFMKVYSWYISASIQANLSYLQTVRSNQYLSKMFNIACFRESTVLYSVQYIWRTKKGAPCGFNLPVLSVLWGLLQMKFSMCLKCRPWGNSKISGWDKSIKITFLLSKSVNLQEYQSIILGDTFWAKKQYINISFKILPSND